MAKEERFKPKRNRKNIKTAVLFIVFNRPDTTGKVFEVLRAVQPPRLYIAADGPRVNKEGEKEACEEVRMVASKVDWECEVKTLFRDNNLGCAIAMGSAIEWFFEHEEQGIILEDDILPSHSLFWFCEEMLNKYASDDEVYSIIGRNELGFYDDGSDASYLFFNRYSSWGSATWRHKFRELYDSNLGTLSNPIKSLKLIVNSNTMVEYLMLRIMNRSIRTGRVSSFAWPFSLSHIINNKLVVCPKKNLVTNIGFDARGTHTTQNITDDIERYEIRFPLKHPEKIELDKTFLNSWILRYNKGRIRLIINAFPFLSFIFRIVVLTIRWLKIIPKKITWRI